MRWECLALSLCVLGVGELRLDLGHVDGLSRHEVLEALSLRLIYFEEVLFLLGNDTLLI